MFQKLSPSNMVVRFFFYYYYYYYLNLSVIIFCGQHFSLTWALWDLECFKRYHLHYWCIVIIIIIWPLFHPFSGQLLAVWIFILFNFPFSKTFFPFLQGPNFWAQYMSLFFLVFPSSFLLPTFKTYNFERVKVFLFLIFWFFFNFKGCFT